MKKINDLIFGYRIPYSIIKNTYTLLNNTKELEPDNIKDVHEKLRSTYFKGMKK